MVQQFVDRLPRTPPPHIVSELKRFDSQLRLRWSREKGKFVLERKVRSSHLNRLPLPVRWSNMGGVMTKVRVPEYSDRAIAYHDGYVEVLSVRRPTRKLFWFLYESDAARYRKNWMRDQEIAEEVKEAQEKVKHKETFADVGGEAFDFIKYKGGERLSMRN